MFFKKEEKKDFEELETPDIGYEVKYIYLDGKMVMYRLYRWQKQYIYIDVHRNGEVNVYASKTHSIKEIEEHLQSKKSMIFWFLDLEQNREVNLSKNYISILGKRYSLHTITKRLPKKFEIIGKKIYINARTNEQKHDVLTEIFKKTACEYIKKRTYFYAKEMGYEVKLIDFKWVKTYWGMCYYNLKRITYTYDLCFFDKELIDTVIVHEVCHFYECSHKKRFYDEVKRWSVDYDKLQHKLEAKIRSLGRDY